MHQCDTVKQHILMMINSFDENASHETVNVIKIGLRGAPIRMLRKAVFEIYKVIIQ